jgi:L-ascorbate metabolism protein UlaG (beta-lactamase superfamily)
VKRALFILTLVFLLVGVSACVILRQPQFGGEIEGERKERIEKSPLFDGKRLENKPPQSRNMEWIKNFKLYMGGQVREPQFEVPVIQLTAKDFGAKPTKELSAVWLGHASVLVEVDGYRLLTDPVFSDVVSPVPGIYGPKRLHPSPVAIPDLKNIDAVLISHDHYDHLDMETIKALGSQETQFFVPLGIGAHLARWGVPTAQIHEMEWWQSAQFKSLKINCTPARHYSGRKAMDNSTLWSSWFVSAPAQSFFFSGDTGYAPHFAEIKQRLGAADLTLMKVGAYGEPEGWADIHMNPEEAIKGHRDLEGKVMLPIHWATFNLAYHAWVEPIERTIKAAEEIPTLKVVTPKVGERFTVGEAFENSYWFRK